jgi:hypothetical protein
VVLADANRALVWVPWYFRQGALTSLTAPLFVFLVFCIAVSAFGAAIQGLALVQASYAVFGAVGALIAISFGWVPVIMPPVLYYSLIKNLPGLWLRPDASRRAKIVSSFTVLVLLPLGSYLVYHAVASGIGWIATAILAQLSVLVSLGPCLRPIAHERLLRREKRPG